MINDVSMLKAMLKQYGWSCRPSFNGKATYWSFPHSGSGMENMLITIPEDKSTDDYEFYLEQAYHEIELIYGKNFETFKEEYQSFSSRQFDPLEIREETGAKDGLIPWNKGRRLVLGAEGILNAGARATAVGLRNRKAHYLQIAHAAAESVLSESFMGQTKIGSYIVTMYVPSEHRFSISSKKNSQNQLMDSDYILGRDVTNTIVSSLQSFESGFHETSGKNASDIDHGFFDELVQDGVSYELLDAISCLLDEKEAQITVAQPVKDVPSEKKTYEISVGSYMSEWVDRGKFCLKGEFEPIRVLVAGEVTRLDNSARNPHHLIKMRLVSNASISAISMLSVHLSSEQYQDAIRAHKAKVMFMVKGEIKKKGRIFEMTLPDFVSVTNTPISQIAEEYNERENFQQTSLF